MPSFPRNCSPGSATAHARRGLACPPHSHTHLGEKRDGTKRARMGADWLFDMDGRPPETSLLEDAVTYAAKNVDMSEWLRRQTRNLLGFACAGSNPAVDDFFCSILPHFLVPRPPKHFVLSAYFVLHLYYRSGGEMCIGTRQQTACCIG